MLKPDQKLRKEKFVSFKEPKMTKSAPMYVYATEMVGSYYSRIGLQGKRVLTIVGSGDQVLNAYWLGARQVMGFDINMRAYYIAQLKFAAVQALTRNDFLRFFGAQQPNVGFQYSLYQDMRPYLTERARSFFDRAYRKFQNRGSRLVRSEYFRQRSRYKKVTPTQINPFLRSDREYLRLRSILLRAIPFRFICADISNVLRATSIKDSKFDVVNLSNAPNYVFGEMPMPEVVRQFTKTLCSFRTAMAPRGKIFFYSYAFENYTSVVRKLPPLSRREAISILGALPGFKLSVARFKGYLNGFDKVIIFQKQSS